MNDIGFLRAFHWFIPGVEDVHEVFDVSDEEYPQKPALLDYLAQCPAIAWFMDRLVDEEGNEIGSFLIHSDGEWVWPSYLTHYLNRPGYRLRDERLLQSAADHNFLVPTFTAEAVQVLTQRYVQFSKTGQW